jgi:alpha-ketoglutarate-dependent taurine dioxygenase
MRHGISDRRDFPTLIDVRRSHHAKTMNELRVYVQQKLLQSGALLIRGFSTSKPVEFAEFVRHVSGLPLQNYVGGASPRQKLTSDVYTSTEYAPDLTLPLHNEMSYTYRWPKQLFFACVITPKEGGETPIADSRAILGQIGTDIVEEFSEKQIQYRRRLPGFTNDGYSWQDAFETDDRDVVEEYCEQGNISFEWKTDGALLLTETRPPTTTHPVTGEEVWFNQADSFHSAGNPTSRLDACFGDGSDISEGAIVRIREAIAAETVLFKWQPGDILVLDNLLTAHGRRSFYGSRKILLAMT